MNLENALDTDRDEFSLVKKYAEFSSQNPEGFDEIDYMKTGLITNPARKEAKLQIKDRINAFLIFSSNTKK